MNTGLYGTGANSMGKTDLKLEAFLRRVQKQVDRYYTIMYNRR